MVNMPASPVEEQVTLSHDVLCTTFRGIVHNLSTDEAPVNQFRGIKYASVPNRFRQSKLCTEYAPIVDASSFGYVPSRNG